MFAFDLWYRQYSKDHHVPWTADDMEAAFRAGYQAGNDDGYEIAIQEG